MTLMVLADKYYADGKVGEAYRYRERAVYYDACPNPEYYDPVMRYSHMEVVLLTYPIIKFTPKGFWIYHYGDKKFILKDSKKKFAALTKLDAMESFIARKSVHVSFAAKRLQRAEAALAVGEKMMKKLKEEEEKNGAAPISEASA